MKKQFNIFFALLFITSGLFAQIDRSQPPKPGPAPKIALDKPKEFKLANGMTVMVVENHKLPKVTYSLRLDREPTVEGNKAGISELMGKMLGNGTLNIPKDKFNDEVDFLGAFMGFGPSGAYATALTRYSDRILQLMADAAMNPLFTEDQFNKEKEKMITNLKSSEKDVSAIASRVGRALSFGVHHPFGEFTTEETINNITLNDVKEYYKKQFHAANSYLVVVGDVKFHEVKKRVEKYFGKWKKGSLVKTPVPPASPNVPKTEIDFVDVPNAVQSNISLTNNVKFRMKDPDYHAVLIANQILGGDFNGYLNMNLREKHGYTYGSYSAISDSKYVSRFRTTAKVRNAVTDSAVVETIKEVRRIRTEPVDPEALKNTKAKYVGNFVLSLEDPQTIAEFAMDIKLKDLPDDFYSTYLQKINAVTASDVKRVANKYFLVDNARVIVVGKASDVLKNLEKTGIPIKYYDKYAKPAQKPSDKVELPKGVTGQTVLSKYLEAIGGKANIDKIKTLWIKIEGEVQPGMLMSLEVKKAKDNKYMQAASIMGNVMNKQVVNGNKGYMEAQGQRKDFSPEEVEKMKGQLAMFTEQYYIGKNPKIEGIEDINGEKAYKVKLSDELTSYYSVNTGLKLKEVQAAKGMVSEMTYLDYKDVNGVKFPSKIKQSMGPQTFDFNMSVKLNEGVTDADFK